MGRKKLGEGGTGGESYALEWADYGEKYGASVRTVQRWVSAGERAGDRVPLDDPEGMTGWWQRNMTHQVPVRLLAAVVEWRKVNGQADPVPEMVPETAVPVAHEVGEHEVGLLATLKRLQDSEVVAHRTYQEAMAKGDSAKATIALKSFKELAAEVVKVQDRYAKHQESVRDLIPRVEAESVLAELHGDILTRFRGMGDAVMREFGIAVTPEAEARWQALVDGLCVTLQEEVFKRP